MKIAVSADGPSLEAAVAANFARSPFYLVVETDDMTFQVAANAWATAGAGAGPEAAGLVAGTGAKVMITGLVGPNAFFRLQECGIQVFVTSGGSVRSAVNAYRAAHLSPLLKPNAQPHTPFSGQGLAHGNPMHGQARGTRRRPVTRSVNSVAVDEQMARLLAALRAMEEEIAAMQERIKELEKERFTTRHAD